MEGGATDAVLEVASDVEATPWVLEISILEVGTSDDEASLVPLLDSGPRAVDVVEESTPTEILKDDTSVEATLVEAVGCSRDELCGPLEEAVLITVPENSRLADALSLADEEPLPIELDSGMLV